MTFRFSIICGVDWKKRDRTNSVAVANMYTWRVDNNYPDFDRFYGASDTPRHTVLERPMRYIDDGLL